MKLIKKLVTGLMILLVALGSSPLEVFALPNNDRTEWPMNDGTNGVETDLPQPPAVKNIVDLSSMFHYPTLDYSGLPAKRSGELEVIKSLKGYVPVNNGSSYDDSSVAVITRDKPWQAGVMWSNKDNKINLAEPFHMVSYVYLGIRGQAQTNAKEGRGGADGITFTIHNDKKKETLSDNDRRVLAGSIDNYGFKAYGALGNGLGVYGSHFSANTNSTDNNMAEMKQGVTNGIALEFDTFYNHDSTFQHTDNDLWQFVRDKESSNPNLGHIAINYLNELQNNKANIDEGRQFGYENGRVIKHNTMLAVGWDGEISNLHEGGGIPGLHYQNGWQVSNQPRKPLADGKWHRLEVSWVPSPTDQKKGKLTYKIYRQGYLGPERAVTTLTPTIHDGNSIIEKTLDIDVTTVFAVPDVNSTVYWGFSGSTGYYQNNQAVQMLQLPEAYYQSEILKKDQDENLVSGAVFELEKWNETTGDWDVQEFYNPKNGQSVRRLMTGSQQEIGVYSGVFQSLGKIKLTQLTKGTYRWKEVAPPEGYQLDKVYYEGYQRDKIYYPEEKGFVVNYANSQEKNAFQYEAKNTKLSQIELYKKDDTGNPLKGVKFTIFKELGGVTSYLKAKSGNTDFEWTPNENDAKQFVTGYSYYVRNGKIEESELAETDKGYIRIGYIENGANLSWKEVKESVPKGYDSSGELTGKFEKSTKDNGYVYSGEQTNSRLYQVSLEKIASDTKAALPGAEFSLEQLVGSDWKVVKVKQTTGENGKITITPGEDGKDTITTDEYGKITISNIKAGTYRWTEVKAPNGYQSSQPDPYVFVVNKESVTEIDGNLATDPDTNNYIIDPTIVENDRKFELTLEKLSSTSKKPLQGVKFELYDSDDSAGEPNFSTLTLIATVGPTGAEGKIVLDKGQIQAGKTYYLVESQTVGGFIRLKGYFTIKTDKLKGFVEPVTYTKDGTETYESPPFEFTKVGGDNYSGNLTIYNKRRESILPATGGNGILGYVGIGLTMTIVALLFFIARKRIFKWLIILMVATSGLAGLAGGTQVVSAQEQEQVQLEVNRLVYQPSDTQYKSGVPVAGAKLEVVDVTKSFYELVNRQKLGLKEAQEAVSKSNKIDGQSLAVATTDQSGLVRFTVSKTSQQRPAVYLIRELVTPVAVTKMENMVVVLPILDQSGNEKSLISLFPKSHGTFTFDKTIDEKQSSYSFGEPIPYRLSTIIPQDMTNLSSYEIEDIYDQGLRFISESLEIFIDGEKQSDSIKAVSLSENQFRVVFDVAKLADFSGKKLEVTYQMVIKDEAAIDQDLVNTATLYPGDLTPLVDRENVQTGGFRFIKRAAEGKQNPLAKATFVIKNPTDDTVLTYKEGKYQFEKVATNASGVVRLTSDDDGYFEIRGLRYGEYLVSEIRAPSGYVLNDKPTAFTVGVSTYSQGPVLSIFNVKKPKNRLPETGTVVTSTAFVGLLIMASSLVMIRRRKDN
ncbi:SpaH/EbpB family LPXTG-anchored major pilin [Streptococcus suis]